MQAAMLELQAAQTTGDPARIYQALDAAATAGAPAQFVERARSELTRVVKEAAEGKSPDEIGGVAKMGVAQVGAAKVGAGGSSTSPAASLPSTSSASFAPQSRPDPEAAAVEKATRLKGEGNAKLKLGSRATVKEARMQYTEALALLFPLIPKLRPEAPKSAGPQAARPEPKKETVTLCSQILGNLAQANSTLGFFAEAVDAARKGNMIDPENLKHPFRAAKASDHLGLAKQALEFASLGLSLPQGRGNVDLLKIVEKAQKEVQSSAGRRRMQRPEDYQAAMEVEAELEAVTKLTREAIMDVEKLKRQTRMKVVSAQEVDKLPASGKTWSQLGRGFLREERQPLMSRLRAEANEADSETIPRKMKGAQALEARRVAKETELKALLGQV